MLHFQTHPFDSGGLNSINASLIGDVAVSHYGYVEPPHSAAVYLRIPLAGEAGGCQFCAVSVQFPKADLWLFVGGLDCPLV